MEVEGWEGGEMVLSPSSLAHGMEGVEVTEGSDEVEGWGGGEVVAGGEGERGAFCLPKGQYSGGGQGQGRKVSIIGKGGPGNHASSRAWAKL